MFIKDLETPVLILDVDLLKHNMQIINEMLKGTSIALRPHYKSHKCAAIVHKQLEMGAKGITCAKLSEAEDLIACGVKDVLIANQIVQPSKVSRLAHLANSCRLTVCVDNHDNIEQLAAAARTAGSVIYCLVEYDTGMGRCGTGDFEKFYTLAKKVQESDGLVFEGIQAYAGHLSHEEDFNKRKEMTEELEGKLLKLKALLEERGLRVKEVSGGSTGTVMLKRGSSIYTEIQAGSYLFMDGAYKKLGLGFKNSLFILSTVISMDTDLIITDAGVKCCGVDQGMPIIEKIPDAVIRLSEEHGCINYDNHFMKIGDELRYIPGHCCTTINLHDYIYLVQGDEVIDKVQVTSRGKCL